MKHGGIPGVVCACVACVSCVFVGVCVWVCVGVGVCVCVCVCVCVPMDHQGEEGRKFVFFFLLRVCDFHHPAKRSQPPEKARFCEVW